MEAPGRTFGLSLAIVVSVLLFTVMPLVQVSMVLLVEMRLANQMTLSLDPDAEAIEPIAMGGDLRGISDSTLFLQMLFSLGFLIVAVFTWFRRPAGIRYIFVFSVALLTVLTLITSVAPLLSQPDLMAGLDSGGEISRSLLTGRALLAVLIPLYVLWYVNRAPARAFFRGYYLPHELAAIAATASATRPSA